jgi:hypothetical protein
MRKGKRKFASRKRKIAGLCAFVLAGVLSVGAYAFTASNTIPEQTAGGGTNAVSGYTEAGVSYTWSLSGEYITAVEFKLTGAKIPTDVAVALSKGKTPAAEEWVDCPEISGAGSPWLVKCNFKTGEGAYSSVGVHATNKFSGAGVAGNPLAEEGTELTVSATSQGDVIIE